VAIWPGGKHGHYGQCHLSARLDEARLDEARLDEARLDEAGLQAGLEAELQAGLEAVKKRN
jgi:hypothetical protein